MNVTSIMEIKFIKELGSGGNGTVYLVERNEKQLVYKLEKMYKYNKDEPLTSEYYRQLKFNKDISIHHPNKFMVVKSHGIIIDCEYKHPNHEKFIKNMKGDRLRRYLRKNSQPNCYFLLYAPYLEGSYGDVRLEIHKSRNKFLDFMYQIIESINIMRKKGYSQNDPNAGNIMYKKKNDKCQWYFIDYGNMCNINFPKSELDKDIGGRPLYCMDLLIFMRQCINPERLEFAKKHELRKQLREFDMKIYFKNLEKEEVYPEIIKHVPSVKNEKMKNSLVSMITKILYPQIDLKCKEVPEEIYKKYDSNQLFPELLIYCFKHHNDKTYDGILNKIKSVMEEQMNIGGYYDKYNKYKTYLQKDAQLKLID